MNHVVHTQIELYSTTWLQFEALFHILGTGNLVFKCHFVCQKAVRLVG